MPTGYTAKLFDGYDQSFEEFAIQCSRAFGAYAHMKDEPCSIDVPEMIPFDLTHEYDNIGYALQLFVDFQNQSDESVEIKMKQEYEYSLEKLQSSIKQKRAAQQRYEDMLRKVEAWTPPTENHHGIKEFMMQQLKDSLVSDCSIDSEKQQIQELQKNNETFEEYRVRETEALQNNLQFAKEQLERKITEIQEKNQWIQEFRKSLKNVP